VRVLVGVVRQLQASQLSVQALTRLAAAATFLLASWTQQRSLPLVAVQGALLAVPYTLLEALVGRALSAGVVPPAWNVEAWATRAAATVALPVGLVGYLSVSVALPASGVADRLLLLAPVLLQLPIEALFWATARTRPRRRANLLPQLTAAGTLAGGAAFAAADLPLVAAALPAQVLMLGWALATRQPVAPGEVRPGAWRSVRVGAVYCAAASVDLAYAVALPAFAGALAGPVAIVVLRAMDLAFGPFHVALSATTREDIVSAGRGRWLTGARVLTGVLLVVISAAVAASADLRGLLAADLAALTLAAVLLYCGYKAALTASTWLGTRHMVRATPRRFLVSAMGSRLVAFAGLAVAAAWVATPRDLFAQLLAIELAVVLWFVARIAGTHAPSTGDAAQPVSASLQR
jgi:hypothetical protein